ncbi:PD-(D/E)XK nuclease family protein [Ligilactobacillus agilis]|uniref:PD-(D/E)XK nuclease family protein n=1 Tax=Ligilactobacillus agilis TaxID=1601 RepID=UPI00191EE3CE|nr:PD-(D/E)XK nuclease family protein [Ligilactobacillus agilis]MBL1054888.1 PD-(D/E)XK nuclease family protein [Ligilactobacillus agilis]
MALGFILGGAEIDHEQAILEQLLAWQKQAPSENYFVIVPDHIKFETEVKVLEFLRQHYSSAKGLYAQTKTQVFSFSRLAWYFIKDQQSVQGRHLSQMGLTMLVQSILSRLDSLHVFAAEKNQVGFAQKLAQQLLELKQGGISPDDLDNLVANLPKDQAKSMDLRAKLTDMALVYRQFELELGDKYVESSKVLQSLNDYLLEADLSQTSFLISGFDQLAALELQLLKTLVKRAKEVRISLVLTKQGLEQASGDDNLFNRPKRLFTALTNWADKNHLPLAELSWPTVKRLSPDLERLGKYWQTSVSLKANKPAPLSSKESVSVVALANRIEEVRYVASQIRQEVAKGERRYRDYMVLAPDLADYENLIAPIFNQYQLPFYLDLSKGMGNHPLVEFLNALFTLAKHPNLYSYHDLMRLLKTELFIPQLYVSDANGQLVLKQNLATFRDELDWLENYLLRTGISSRKRFEAADFWLVERLPLKPNQSQAEHEAAQRKLLHNQNANLLKTQVAKLLASFSRALAKVKTNRDFARVLYQFLIKAGVDQSLATSQARAQKRFEEGKLNLVGINAQDATRPEQVWNTLCALLDEYVLALGDQDFSLSNFSEILNAGFKAAKYKQVPTTLDQVTVSKANLSQRRDRRVLFFLGASDQALPARFENNSLISEEERQLLASGNWLARDQFLAPGAEMAMADEPYQAYLSFLTAKDRLVFTYPQNDADGQLLACSPYVKRIMAAFGLKETDVRDRLSAFLGTPRTLLTDLLTQSRAAFQNQADLDSQWQAILAYELAVNQTLTLKLLNSLDYHNEILPNTKPSADGHKRLIKELLKELYRRGKNAALFGSVSRLESFYANPYEFFLKYGLQLEKRKEFMLSPADTGTYFHNLLDEFMRLIHADKTYLKRLTSREFDHYMKRAVTNVQQQAKEQEGYLFDASARLDFLRQQLESRAYQVGQAIWKQRQDQAIYTLETEATFGFQANAQLDGLVFPAGKRFAQDETLNLQGRIDRLDLVISELNRHYLSVVDYKSGNTDLKLKDFLTKALNGLSLQLLTYLAVLQKDSNQAKLKQLLLEMDLPPAEQLEVGATTYLNLFSGRLAFKDYQPLLEKKKTFEDLFMQQYQYKGLFRLEEDADFLLALDQKLKAKPAKSLPYNISHQSSDKFKANGSSQLLTLEQLEQLVQLNLQKIEQARQEIFGGIIDLKPYKLDNQTDGLLYSDYLPIMLFDPMVGNEYRKIKTLSTEEVWAQIKHELQKG